LTYLRASIVAPDAVHGPVAVNWGHGQRREGAPTTPDAPPAPRVCVARGRPDRTGVQRRPLGVWRAVFPRPGVQRPGLGVWASGPRGLVSRVDPNPKRGD